MNFLKKFIYFISILLILTNFITIIFSVDDSLTILSPKYFEEGNNKYSDIHYLKNEYLSFNLCVDSISTDKTAKLICKNEDPIELPLFDSKTKGCFYSNLDLEIAPCNDFSLEINYKQDNKEKKFKRTFKKQKQSLLINHILNQDYKKLDPLNLSYYLIVLNDLEDITNQKNNDVYEKLKTDRNNVNKCWPTSVCNIAQTTAILNNLKFAGYDLNSRLLKDGKNYLEKNMISNVNNALKSTINISNIYTNNSDISCAVQIDTETSKNYIFDSTNKNLEKYLSKSISFTCNESVDKITFNLYDLENKIKETKIYLNSNTFTYTIQDFACIGKSGICNYDSTINSLITYSSKISNANLLENYVDGLIYDDSFNIYFKTTQEVKDTGKYLYYKNNERLLNNLKFIQNNDGSWGSGLNSKKVEQTSWAIRGLQKKEKDNEYVKDAKKWIYFNEPIGGWKSTQKNALAYIAIKEKIKPYLKISSKNSIKKKTEFTILNPTIYNLKDIKLNFDENLNSFLSYSENLGDIGSDDEIKFNISINDGFFGFETGDLILTGVDGKNTLIELIKMPISLEGPKPFEIIYKKNISISEEGKDIYLDIKKNLMSFNVTCSFINPFNKIPENIIVNQDLEKIKISNRLLIDGNFSLDLNCLYDKNSFSFPIEFTLDIAQKIFEIKEEKVIINSLEDFFIEITNIDKQKKTLYFEIEGDLKDYINVTEKSKIIAANDTREIFFSIIDKEYIKTLNSTTTNILIKSNTGYTKKIPIKLGFNQVIKNQSISIWYFIGIGIFVFLGILIMVIRTIRQNQYEEEDELVNPNGNQEDDEEMYFEE